jgi:hypothetical protein
MSTTYGRNFSFRIPPRAERRHGRYAVPATGTKIPIGAPIQATAGADPTALDMQPVTLVTAAGPPVIGMSGLVVYEYGPAAFAGDDALLTTYSDKGDVPLGAAVQMIHGTEVKVVFKNTVDSDFLDARAYAGRTFVAGMGATPTVEVGELLTPGPGNDNDGFWQVTADAANAWLRVVHIDTVRLEVEAEFVF